MPASGRNEIKARFLPEAQAEFLREITYYANIRTSLGQDFRLAVMAAVSRAALWPTGGAPSHAGTRSYLVKGFPFSVIYRAGDSELLIVAVSHHRRRPGYWAQRNAEPRG